MLFYIQMRWNIEGRLSPDELWDLEAKEGEYAQVAVSMGKVKSIYKVSGQRRVIAIVEVDDATELDRIIMGGLPMAQYLEFEAIWPLREYEPFIEDVKMHYKEQGPANTQPTT